MQESQSIRDQNPQHSHKAGLVSLNKEAVSAFGKWQKVSTDSFHRKLPLFKNYIA